MQGFFFKLSWEFCPPKLDQLNQMAVSILIKGPFISNPVSSHLKWRHSFLVLTKRRCTLFFRHGTPVFPRSQSYLLISLHFIRSFIWQFFRKGPTQWLQRFLGYNVWHIIYALKPENPQNGVTREASINLVAKRVLNKKIALNYYWPVKIESTNT